MGSALVLARREGQRPARATLGLGVIILGLAFLPFWRAEPFTQALSVLLTLVALMFWAATLRTGDWLRYTLWDDLRALAVLGFAAVTRPLQRPPADEDTATEPAGAAFWRRGGAVLRGVALALPVVGVAGVAVRLGGSGLCGPSARRSGCPAAGTPARNTVPPLLCGGADDPFLRHFAPRRPPDPDGATYSGG